MKIIDDLISALNFDASVKDIRQGVFHTGVLTRYCGLAATLPRDALKQEGPLVKEPGFLLDKTPRDGDFNETEADRFIPLADVVALTGTSLTNHTLPHLLELCNPEAFVIMLGDTVPLSPVLFDYGVHALSGTRVIDADLALRCVSQGANFRQIKGTKKLTMTRP